MAADRASVRRVRPPRSALRVAPGGAGGAPRPPRRRRPLPETARFESQADRLAGIGISTLYVNATSDPGALSAFAWLALHGSPAHPPTRVRWRCGSHAAEGWWPGDRGWAALAPESAHARLHARLGLVVDLHAICEDP